MNDMQKAAMRPLPKPNPGDYYDGKGLLVCGKCGYRRTVHVYIPELGIDRISRCSCACESESDRIDERAEARKRNARILRVFPSIEFADMTFNKTEECDAKTAAMKYCDSFIELKKDGIGMVLQGPKGTGKTHIAACIANEVSVTGKRAMFFSIPRIADLSFKSGGQAIEELRTLSLAVVDDFGAERDTSSMGEIAYRVINTLYESKVPMIVTTNCDLYGLLDSNGYYSRAADRILERCPIIRVEGENRRESNSEDNMRKFAEILA